MTRQLSLKRAPRRGLLSIFLLPFVYFNEYAFTESPDQSKDDAVFDKQREETPVEGTMAVSKTNPPFKIWLFPNDSMTNVILKSGLYEPQETQFISYVASQCEKNTPWWAVDIGANVGFHSLHMASLDMNVISFEPSPDTVSLLRRSMRENGFENQRMHIIQAAASDRVGTGRLVRHRDSSGMTILQRTDEDVVTSPLPFGVLDIIANDIPLITTESSVDSIIPRGQRQNLCLLKVDAEGHELQAFKGANLHRHRFKFITFEFFPELLLKAGKTMPLDVVTFIQAIGYDCTTEPMLLKANQGLLTTSEEVTSWYEGTIVKAHKTASSFHLNLYCRLR